MINLHKIEQHRGFLPGIFQLYLLLQIFFPSHWHTILLGIAVIVAARNWEVKGGLLATLGAGVSLLYGLYRVGGPELLSDRRVMEGYFWAYVATLALAIYVGSLTRHTRTMIRVNEDLRHAQQRLAALHSIALSLSTTLDVNRLMEKILEQLGKLWGYDYGSILLVEEGTGDLIVAESRGYDVERGTRIPAGSGICGEVVRTGVPICIGDVTQDPRYVPGIEGCRSELAVPLIWEGRILGVLNVESRLPNAYGPGDVTLLSTVAEQAAASLGNARLHQHTQELAVTDPHTGLYNYRFLQQQITSMVRDSQLSGQPFSLIMLDVDHFKRVNDTYGHPTGDAILEQVAKLLRETVRGGDLCYRYGGEEFSVSLPGATVEVAVRVAERIREKVAAHAFVTKSGRKLDHSITVSLGVASFPRDAVSHVDLLLAADKALYAAKSAGRNRVMVAGTPGSKAQLEPA